MLDLGARYPGQVVTTDPAYPQGKARNRVGVGDSSGTPYEADLVNDLHGAHQAIVAWGGITPSETPDKVGDSDLVRALNARLGTTRFVTWTGHMLVGAEKLHTFSVGTQDNDPVGMTWKPDGTVMYIVGDQNNSIYQYTLSTAWDLSTASYASLSFSFGTQDLSPRNVSWKPDGTKLYVVGDQNNRVYQYTAATPWNVSTLSYDSVSVLVVSQDATLGGIAWKPDGSKFVITGATNQKLFQYTCSTPWNLSTATYDTIEFAIPAEHGTGPSSLAWNHDGTRLLVGLLSTRSIIEISIAAIPYQLNGSATSFSGQRFGVGQDSPVGVAWGDSGRRLYVLGGVSDSVSSYYSSIARI